MNRKEQEIKDNLTMEPIKCPYCSCQTMQLWEEKNFTIQQCNACFLIFKNIPHLNRKKIEELQSGLYSDFEKRSKVKALYKMTKDRINILKQYKTNGKLLEIGCGTGSFLIEAKQQGFDVTGLDASSNYIESINNLGLNVKYGRIEDVNFEYKKFDVIAMSHLLEHIENPTSFLENVKKYLTPNGILFIVVPNADSLTNRILGYKHPVYQQADHLYFFSKKTLTNYLESSGFVAQKYISKEYTHHIFMTIRGLYQYQVSHRKVNDNITTPKKSNHEEVSYITTKGKVKSKIPYILGQIFYPFTKSYSIIMEKILKGHELIVVATIK